MEEGQEGGAGKRVLKSKAGKEGEREGERERDCMCIPYIFKFFRGRERERDFYRQTNSRDINFAPINQTNTDTHHACSYLYIFSHNTEKKQHNKTKNHAKFSAYFFIV